jgi:hypothetical protein
MPGLSGMNIRRAIAAVLAGGGLVLLAYWLSRSERPPVPIGSIVFAAASLFALVVRMPRGLRRRPRHTSTAAGSALSIPRGRAFPILALLVLSAVGAELLAAYNDTTGRPGAIAFSVVFFAALYGCPALLIREISRRAGDGWWTIVLLAAAFGLFEAGVVDQALFADSYGEVKGWEETLRATYVDPLGIAAFPAQNYVVGHILFSFCAPIALAEAMRPAIADRPWLGRPGIVVTVSAWLVAAGLVFSEALGERYASLPEITVTLALVAGLILVALRGPRPPRATQRAPRERTVLAASFVLTTAATAVPETWLGFAIAIGVTATGAWLLLRFAGGPGWTLAHTAAVAGGAFLSRGCLAFLYYPLVGETSALQKYSHNVVMLLLVVAASVYAYRRAHAV